MKLDRDSSLQANPSNLFPGPNLTEPDRHHASLSSRLDNIETDRTEDRNPSQPKSTQDQ